MATAIQSYKLLISSIYSGDSNREIGNLSSVLQGVIHPPEIRLVFEWKLFCNKLLDSVLDWTFSNLQNCIRFRGSLESLSNRRALGPIGSKLKVVRKWQLSISDIFIRTKNAWRVILGQFRKLVNYGLRYFLLLENIHFSMYHLALLVVDF